MNEMLMYSRQFDPVYKYILFHLTFNSIRHAHRSGRCVREMHARYAAFVLSSYTFWRNSYKLFSCIICYLLCAPYPYAISTLTAVYVCAVYNERGAATRIGQDTVLSTRNEMTVHGFFNEL